MFPRGENRLFHLDCPSRFAYSILPVNWACSFFFMGGLTSRFSPVSNRWLVLSGDPSSVPSTNMVPLHCVVCAFASPASQTNPNVASKTKIEMRAIHTYLGKLVT